MTLPDLESLIGSGKLKREAPNQSEFEGLLKLGDARFKDAQIGSLSLESRFDLAFASCFSPWSTPLACHVISGVCSTRLTAHATRPTTAVAFRSTSACCST